MDEQCVYANRVHVSKDKTNPRRLAVLTLLLFSSSPGWPLLLTGILLVVAAVTLHGWAAGFLARAGYAEREKILTVRGPYRHNRNPYYLAQLMMDLGFFLLAGQSLLFLFYFPIIFTVYRRWIAAEERFLETEFGNDYLALKREVPRWGFRLRPAPARGSDIAFQWSTYRINHELPRSLSHVCIMLAFVLYSVFGNPLAQIDFWLRLTLLAVAAGWLIVRDIYPINGVDKSIAWSLAALGVALFGMFFLTSAPLWQPWSGATAWTAITIGLYCSLAVTLRVFPGFSRASNERPSQFVTRPLCQWYALMLGLGLLSCTLGGLWMGVLFSLVAWSLTIGRWLSVKMIPQRIPVGIFLLALVTAASSAAVLRQFD